MGFVDGDVMQATDTQYAVGVMGTQNDIVLPDVA